MGAKSSHTANRRPSFVELQGQMCDDNVVNRSGNSSSGQNQNLVRDHNLWPLSPDQTKTYFLLGIYTLPYCWFMVVPVFIAFEPKHVCLPPPPLSINNNASYSFGECSLVQTVVTSNGTNSTSTWDDCPYGVEFDTAANQSGTTGIVSIVTDWNLVCSKFFYAEVSTMVFMVGQPIGNFLFTPLADRFGRKPIMLIAGCLSSLFGMGVALSDGIGLFAALRFIQSATAQGCSLVAFTLVVESLSPKQRNIGGVAFNFFWTLGLLTISFLANFLRQWRHLYWVLSSPALLLSVAYIWLIGESGMWRKEREEVVDPGKVRLTKPNEAATLKVINRRFSVFFYWRILKRLLIVGYLWFVNNLVYYGLNLSSPTLDGNLYLNFFLGGLVEVVATGLVVACISFVGRRILLLIFHVISGVALGVIAFLPHGASKAIIVLFMVGKFGSAGSFNILFLYAQELFPTSVRSSSVGIVSSIGSVAVILAPYAFLLTKVTGPEVTNSIFGATSLLAGLLVLLLPETLDKVLPSNIDDI